MSALSSLVEALEAKAREHRTITYETAARQAAEKPLHDATASALEEIAAEVRQIESSAGDPAQARAAVEALVARLDDEVRQANSGLGDLPDIASFLLNPHKLFDMLGNTGRQDGIRQAAEIVRRFLKG